MIIQSCSPIFALHKNGKVGHKEDIVQKGERIVSFNTRKLNSVILNHFGKFKEFLTKYKAPAQFFIKISFK